MTEPTGSTALAGAGSSGRDATAARVESPAERLARRMLFAALREVDAGSLEVTLPDGAVERFAGNGPGPSAALTIYDPAFFRRMLLGGELGAGESYIRGEWSSDSPADVVRFGIHNRGRLKRGGPLFWLGAAGAWLFHQTRRNTRRGATANIGAHYDLGNDFFALFLDPSMTYSCAYFEHEDQPLAEAQRAKYRRLAEKVDLRPGHRVLEIGCGWGGFAELAAGEYDCRVTGITISPRQAEHARERMRRAGLQDRVEIELRDYRAVEGRFDRVVSIEMLEAVGHAYLPAYFAAIDRVLVGGGRAAIQVITMPDRRYLRYRLRPDYIQKFIFPGAHLPSLGAMQRAMKRRTRLTIDGLEDIASHYACTLALWRKRFLERRGEVRALGFDRSFVRRWDFYFAYSEAAFRARYIANLQLTLSRVGEART